MKHKDSELIRYKVNGTVLITSNKLRTSSKLRPGADETPVCETGSKLEWIILANLGEFPRITSQYLPPLTPSTQKNWFLIIWSIALLSDISVLKILPVSVSDSFMENMFRLKEWGGG